MEFQSFDSLEDMQEAMRANEAAAQARVTDQQRRLTFGDYWFRPMGPEYDHMFIFGRIQAIDEFVAAELLQVTGDGPAREEACTTARQLLRHTFDDPDLFAAALRGDTELKPVLEMLRRVQRPARPRFSDEQWESFVFTATMLADSYRRGYRFTRAYSKIVPDGEYGDTHVVEMVPSTAAEFSDAEKASWDFAALAHPYSPQTRPWAQELVLNHATLGELHHREVQP